MFVVKYSDNAVNLIKNKFTGLLAVQPSTSHHRPGPVDSKHTSLRLTVCIACRQGLEDENVLGTAADTNLLEIQVLVDNLAVGPVPAHLAPKHEAVEGKVLVLPPEPHHTC